MKSLDAKERIALVDKAVRDMGIEPDSSPQQVADAIFAILIVTSRLVYLAQRNETNGVDHAANADRTFKRFLEIRP